MQLPSPLLRAIFLAPLLALLPLLPIHGQLFMDNNGTTAGFGDSGMFNASTWSVGGTNWTENAAGTGPLISWNNTSGATTFWYIAASSANIRVEDDFTVSGLRLDGGGAGEIRLGRGTAGDPNPTVAITVQNGGEVFVENGRTLAIGFTNAPVSLRGSFTKTGGGDLLFNSPSGQIGAANITIEEGRITTGTNNLGSTTSFALNGGDLRIQPGDRSIGSLSGTSGNVVSLQGSSSGALTINQTTDGVFAGIITSNPGTGTRSVTKDGEATLTLTGDQTYDGTTTVRNGTLTLNQQTGSILSTSPLTLQGGRFNMDNIGASGALSQSLGTLRFDAGDGTVQTTRTADQDQSLTFSSLAMTTGATGNFVNGGGTNSTTNGFNLGGRDAGFINHRLFYGGSDYVWMDGDNTYVRGINYGVDSETATSSGAASLTGVAHQQITGAITAQNTATFTTLKVDGNHDFTLNAGQTVTVNGILKSGDAAGGATISGGTGIRAASNVGLVVRTDGANDALTISSPILSNGGNSLIKSGAGTLTLSGTNTYWGQTFVNGGTLSIGANVNLGNQAGGLELNLNNGTLQATATFGLFNGSPGTNNRNVVLTNAGGFDVTSGHTLTVAGVVSGGGSLIKSNVGTLALTGTNTYTGATAVNVGTLLISGTGAINSTSGITVNTGGTLSYSSSTGLNRNITLNTGGTFIHNGSNAYTGTLTWNGGTLAGTNFSGVSLTVGANKTLSPGNSPGTMETASQTWENGGNYNLQIFNFAQAAGTGFDTIAITGTLDLTAVTAGGFNINLWSLSAIGPDVDGDALNFDNLASGSWLIVSTTGGISGFDASKFDIHVGANNGTAGFSNDLGGGNFTVSHLNDNLYLEFIPIPEPSSVLLLGLGLAALMLRKRK